MTKAKRTTLTLRVLFAAITVITVLTFTYKLSKSNQVDSSKHLITKIQYAQNNNGTYTSTANAFSFEYPNDVFKSTNIKKWGNTESNVVEFLTAPTLAVPYLTVSTFSLDSVPYSVTNNITTLGKMNLNQISTVQTGSAKKTVKKLSNVSKGSLNGFTYYTRSETLESEGNTNYNLVLSDQSKVILISLGFYENEIQNETLFNEIVSTFKDLN